MVDENQLHPVAPTPSTQRQLTQPAGTLQCSTGPNHLLLEGGDLPCPLCPLHLLLRHDDIARCTAGLLRLHVVAAAAGGRYHRREVEGSSRIQHAAPLPRASGSGGGREEAAVRMDCGDIRLLLLTPPKVVVMPPKEEDPRE